ncbi:hypothetical protein GJ496_005626 [Pomphorhynchus laevis]|nr:hypothetical protein GJ496_005626 [Pomphorhynchus laevis]
MASHLIIAGISLAAVGVCGSILSKVGPSAVKSLQRRLAVLNAGSFDGLKYYRGGFESKMTKREAGLILGVSAQSSNQRVREAYRRIMILNHPDKGGSPYIAAKINQAKDMLESKGN